MMLFLILLLMKIFIIIFSVIINNIQISSGYIYQELTESLVKSVWNISLHVRETKGIVLYAIDSQAQLLIKFTEENNDSRIFITFNIFSKPSLTIYAWSIKHELKTHLHVIISKRKDIFNITGPQYMQRLTDWNQISLLNFKKMFLSMPIPKGFLKYSKKTFIFMGNIGPYDGYNKTYYPSKSHLNGCLEYFYSNLRPVSMQQNGAKFLKSCEVNSITNYICNKGGYLMTNLPIHMFDCSLPILNEKYCTQIEMLVSTADNQSLIKRSSIPPTNHRSSIINFAWKQIYSRNYCLLEIDFNGGQVIQVAVDMFNYASVRRFNNENNNNNESPTPTIIKTNKLLLNDINNLFIEFSKKQIIIKISDGYQINTIIGSLIAHPITINVGNPQKRNNCERFVGAFGITYNLSEWFMQYTAYNQSATSIVRDSDDRNNLSLFLLIGGLLVWVSILLITMIITYKKYFSIYSLINNRHRSGNGLYIHSVRDISRPVSNSDDYGTVYA